MTYVLTLRRILLFLGDLFLFYTSLIIALTVGFGNNLSWQIFLEHLIPFSILLPFWLFVFFGLGGYNLKILKEKPSLVLRVFLLLVVVALSSVIFFYVFKGFGITPKTNLAVFSLVFCALLLGERILVARFFSSHLQQKIAIFGITPESESLVFALRKNPQLGWKFVQFLDERNIEDISSIVKEEDIDTIIFAKNIGTNKQLSNTFFNLLPLKINFLDMATAYEIMLKRIPISFVDQAWFLENLTEGKKEFFDKTKRIFDIFLALFFLTLSSPLWLIISLAIKLEDRGPIFYKQERMGKNLKKFKILKFRTMKVNAEETGTPWSKGKKDPRITKVGRILRCLHFDEPPQMLNVLKGELSFVGPRPEHIKTIAFLETEIPYYHLRHLIKPGFTGWAYVNSGYESTMGEIKSIQQKIRYDFEKVEYDLYYIKKRSVILDLHIFFKTFKLLFRL